MWGVERARGMRNGRGRKGSGWKWRMKGEIEIR